MAAPGEPTVRCFHCGREALTGAAFCTNCGRSLDEACRQCGSENPQDARLCHQCGASLDSQIVHTDMRAAPNRPPSGMQISCPRCARVNEPGSTYCYSCGLALEGVTTGVESEVWAGGMRAGFRVRFAAYVIDGVLLAAVVSLPLSLALEGSVGDWAPTLVEVSYFTLAVAVWSRTVGKAVLKLRVVRPDGSRVGFWRALARALAYWFSAAIIFIGFLMVALRKDRRALHDIICDTVVIRSDS